MIGRCPKCEATPNIVVETLRARDEAAQRTMPVLQFLCDQCKTTSASRLILNGRHKRLRDNSARLAKDLRRTIEHYLATQF